MSTYDLILRGGILVTADGPQDADLAVEDGRIAAIGPDLEGGAKEEIDASGLHVVHAQGPTKASYRLDLSWGGDMQGTYSYVIHAYEDVRQKRPLKHQHGGTTVLTDGPSALGWAEVLAKEFPDGWVYIHVEYRGT